jgi:hypothetical protein
MDDTCTYFIQLRGQVAADELNTRSPLLLTLIDAEPAVTRLTATTDHRPDWIAAAPARLRLRDSVRQSFTLKGTLHAI